jgi:general secretion pathway protein J
MAMPAARPRQRGFTLVELLLAITLMSLLLALAYGGLSAATRSSERGQEMLEQTSRLRITHQFIRRQLNLMLPLGFAIEGGENGIRSMFVGGPGSIQFVAPMPGYLGNGGPQVQLLEIQNAADGLRLQFSHELLQGFAPELLQERDPVVLLEGLQTAQFEFLEGNTDGTPLGWVADWPTPEQLPLAVRLQLEMPEGAVVTWPVLTASARLDASAVNAMGAGVSDYSDAIQDMIKRSGGQRD